MHITNEIKLAFQTNNTTEIQGWLNSGGSVTANNFEGMALLGEFGDSATISVVMAALFKETLSIKN